MLQITIFKDTEKHETTVARIVDSETLDELAAMDRETGLIDFSVLEGHIGEIITVLTIDITNSPVTTLTKEEKVLLSVKTNSEGIATIKFE